MFWLRYSAILILIASAVIGFFVWVTTGGGGRFDFKLGLDLSGGTHLVYRADTSKLKSEDIADSLGTLREVIERRVNAFGVGEPVVETEQGGALGQGEHRLVVELPGVTDIEEATAMIGRTPLLEFKLVKKEFEKNVSDEHGDPSSSSIISSSFSFDPSRSASSLVKYSSREDTSPYSLTGGEYPPPSSESA
ncbi:MAG: Preprotein translocase subunit SecD [Candidatus Adlerbacteria bacterium GW2011_GWA1_54_10]|uniref:Preprotein translocase subunit SecD n=1 Tax=Candidatus Adlerbacteria bacterium GW2011_GWA1_54_10 TaxID=1618605 RepID=A0A0G2ASJ3_9BACT|nr:MAG: Preprotein translocase subunit SecD [Candidatus Adlerbacteria bacterium GW2011_GWA1_54_10]